MSAPKPTLSKEELRFKIEALRDECPDFLTQKSQSDWSIQLNKLLDYLDKQPQENLLKIQRSIDLFQQLYDDIKELRNKLDNQPTQEEINDAFLKIQRSQRALDESLIQTPEKIKRCIATIAVSILSAAVGVFLGAATGALYGFLHAFPGTNFSTAFGLGCFAGAIGGVFGGIIGGAFAWESLSNRYRSTGDTDLSTLFPKQTLEQMRIKVLKDHPNDERSSEEDELQPTPPSY